MIPVGLGGIGHRPSFFHNRSQPVTGVREPVGAFLSQPRCTVHYVEVKVIRSERRRKTVQAQVVDGVLQIAIPAQMTSAEEAHWVGEMQRRMARQSETDQVPLSDRAARLAARFGLPQPASIEWSARQRTRWGSATIGTRKVRLSSRLERYPRWVLDYVIVHELAHLVEANHSPAFWHLVDRYPLTERARGYLIARGEAGD